MPELSKTARASMGKQVKEVHIETTEEAIQAIRNNRAAGLHIGDMSRVDKLLAAYDEAMLELKDMAEAGIGLVKAIIPEAIVSMASIPAQEEDPNHLSDFELDRRA
jgi:hypothetical protein